MQASQQKLVVKKTEQVYNISNHPFDCSIYTAIIRDENQKEKKETYVLFC
jgi:hypothetical protein